MASLVYEIIICSNAPDITNEEFSLGTGCTPRSYLNSVA